jgi:hypothetical protein
MYWRSLVLLISSCSPKLLSMYSSVAVTLPMIPRCSPEERFSRASGYMSEHKHSFACFTLGYTGALQGFASNNIKIDISACTLGHKPNPTVASTFLNYMYSKLQEFPSVQVQPVCPLHQWRSLHQAGHQLQWQLHSLQPR